MNFSEKKCHIESIEKGIDFLGYFVKMGYTLARRRVVKSFKQKKNIIKKTIFTIGEEKQSKKNIQREISVINSYCGHTNRADSYNLRKKLLDDLLKVRLEFCVTGNYGKVGLLK